jgi:hypothetical protein
MFSYKFGLELEFTGITRERAADVAAEVIGGRRMGSGRTCSVKAPDGRVWEFVYDGSVTPLKKEQGCIVGAGDDYKVEMVSPILTYREDIDTLQEIVRRLRKAGAFTKGSVCGCHIHLDSAAHTPKSVRNFINIVASKNDLFYKALQIEPDRMRFCKKMDGYLVDKMNSRRPRTFEQIKSVWYEGYTESQSNRYHQSRYHFLNLHSLFTRHRTIELRGFNSGDANGHLHAGKIRSYVVLALALNNQALTQKSASCKKPQAENEKFAMRVYLNRIGFIGEEFKNCREHLCCHLSGNSAWRYRVGT